jgi:hypothetical protein
MKYTDEIGSIAMIYIPRFIKTGSAIQKLMRGKLQTDTGRIEKKKKVISIWILDAVNVTNCLRLLEHSNRGFTSH